MFNFSVLSFFYLLIYEIVHSNHFQISLQSFLWYLWCMYSAGVIFEFWPIVLKVFRGKSPNYFTPGPVLNPVILLVKFCSYFYITYYFVFPLSLTYQFQICYFLSEIINSIYGLFGSQTYYECSFIMPYFMFWVNVLRFFGVS